MKNKKIVIILGILILLGLGFYLLTTFKTKPVEEVAPYANANITVQTFQENEEWGYDILIDGNLYVHQPNIPAVPGGNGFKTQADAEKVAGLVVVKIINNILPPI